MRNLPVCIHTVYITFYTLHVKCYMLLHFLFGSMRKSKIHKITLLRLDRKIICATSGKDWKQKKLGGTAVPHEDKG